MQKEQTKKTADSVWVGRSTPLMNVQAAAASDTGEEEELGLMVRRIINSTNILKPSIGKEEIAEIVCRELAKRTQQYGMGEGGKLNPDLSIAESSLTMTPGCRTSDGFNM